MTIQSTISRIQYSPNGSTSVFSFPYLFLEDAHLIVTITSAAGVDTLQALTADYTVADAGDPSGGSITMVVDPVSGTTLTIERVVPITQLVNYITNDDFPAETHETALDRLTMICQQLSESADAILARVLRYPDTEPASTSGILPSAANRADNILAFDSTGEMELVTIDSLVSQITPSQGSITTSAPAGTATEKSVTVSIDTTGIYHLIDVWIVNGSATIPVPEIALPMPDGQTTGKWQVMSDTNGDATVTIKNEGASANWRLCFSVNGSTVISLPITIGV